MALSANETVAEATEVVEVDDDDVVAMVVVVAAKAEAELMV